MVKLSVCIGSACHLRGAYNVFQTFLQLIEENSVHDKIDLATSFCMSKCDCQKVAVSVDGEKFTVDSLTSREFFREHVLTKI